MKSLTCHNPVFQINKNLNKKKIKNQFQKKKIKECCIITFRPDTQSDVLKLSHVRPRVLSYYFCLMYMLYTSI